MVAANFIMVVDGERFQAMALLLAASIRRVHGSDPRIIGYTPSHNAGSLTKPYFKAAETVGLEHATMETAHITWRERYPHGNKIIACAQARDGDVDIFLDTDTVLMAPLDLDALAVVNTVSVVPEGVPTWGRNDADWHPVYTHFDLPIPDQRVNMVRGRKVSTLPYFNAGLVAFTGTAQGNTPFGDIWLETALEVDHKVEIDDKRPWLDQITLPVSIARSGAKMNVLDQYHNYSMYRRGDEMDPEVLMAHYHLPGVFRKYQRLIEILDFAETQWGADAPFSGWFRPFRISRRDWLAQREKA